jgi:hypothetical protein
MLVRVNALLHKDVGTRMPQDTYLFLIFEEKWMQLIKNEKKKKREEEELLMDTWY